MLDVNDRHEDLFTSGAYVSMFQPDSPLNPFAKLYGAKRGAVIAAVEGRDQRILDVGGGAGRMAIALAERHFVTLSDISPQMLELARPHAGERLRLCLADARRLPFPADAFDCVVCIDVLCHLPNPETALREFRRVLRPAGRLIVDSTNSVPFWTLAYPGYLGPDPRRWLASWRAGGVLPEWRSRVWHRRKRVFLTSLLEAGFRVLQLRGFGPLGCPKWHLAIAEAG
jgi:glycogen(starch) synthase